MEEWHMKIFGRGVKGRLTHYCHGILLLLRRDL
jgi:hypothetical protein